ncbi:amidase family protein [Clavibacter nebraskensis]|nr:amidase family protein [Clavibacter nebraskensis]UKF28240.1 amidase [Clavibacter nebraskensis]
MILHGSWPEGLERASARTVWRVVGDPLVHGAPDGPLTGIRVAVKDLYAVRGHVVGAGNPTWERSAPVSTVTAPAVQVLLDAGADVTGIARTDEFAYSLAGQNAHFGSPPNGAAPTRIGGGSSSGSASAVALGQADLGLGTDTAGSLRVPSSYQGLWGLRTTHGSVPRDGLVPLAQSFDTVGWIARSASVLASAADAAVRPGPGVDVDVDLDDGTLLVCDALLDAVEPATAEAFRGWLAATRRPVRRIDLPPPGDLAETLRIVQAAEAWRNHGPWIDAHPGAVGDDVAARFAAAATITAEDEALARERLDRLRTRVREAIGTGVLTLPTVPGPAPLRTSTGDAVQRTRLATLRMTAVAGIGGLPAVSAPFLQVEDAPVGVCLLGPAGSDRAIVALAGTMS